jgi:hypothetical protein
MDQLKKGVDDGHFAKHHLEPSDVLATAKRHGVE